MDSAGSERDRPEAKRDDDWVDQARVVAERFFVDPEPMTDEERRYRQLPEHLKPEAVAAKRGTLAYVELCMEQQHTLSRIEKREREEEAELYARVARAFGGGPFDRSRARRR